MKISNEFTVHTPIERAWQVLTDLPGIAPCMPGARLTGVDGDVYQGKVKVKVGPVISEFAGTARFTEKDSSAYRAAIDAKGRDARSAGNASAVVTAVLKASGDSTLVSVDTDLKISGKLAQFGSGMIKEVSGKLLAQFVTNLEEKLAAEDEGVTTPPAADGTSAAESSGSAAAGPSGRPPSVASGAASGTVADAAVSPADLAPTPVPSVEEAALAESPVPTQEPKPGGEARLAGTEPPAAIRTVPPAPLASDEEAEALDLLAVAGGSIYKRLVPVAIGVVAVGAVIVWLVARR